MEKTNKITPLFDRVLLAYESDAQPGGIIVPTSSDDRSRIMRIVHPGQSTQVKLADRVIVAKYAGTEVTLAGEKFLLVCEYDILGVLHV